MDREALRAAAPRDFLALTNPAQQKAVTAFIGQIIAAIAADEREPDDWEGPDLAAAIGYAFVGWRSAALTLALRALTELERRGERAENPHAGEVATLRDLAAAHDDLRQLSYRDR